MLDSIKKWKNEMQLSFYVSASYIEMTLICYFYDFI